MTKLNKYEHQVWTRQEGTLALYGQVKEVNISSHGQQKKVIVGTTQVLEGQQRAGPSPKGQAQAHASHKEDGNEG